MAGGVFARAHDSLRLVPVDEEAQALVAKLKPGQGLEVTAKKARNLRFHRKFFALVNLAFDVWEPPPDRTYRGQPVRKDKKQFRKELLILAGYCDPVFRLDGTFTVEARSIAFAKCDEFEFNDVYKAVLDVVWEKVLRHAQFASPEEVDQVVMQLLDY